MAGWSVVEESVPAAAPVSPPQQGGWAVVDEDDEASPVGMAAQSLSAAEQAPVDESDVDEGLGSLMMRYLTDAAIQVPAGFNRGVAGVLSFPKHAIDATATLVGADPGFTERYMSTEAIGIPDPVGMAVKHLTSPEMAPAPETDVGRTVGTMSEMVGAGSIPFAGIASQAQRVAQTTKTLADVAKPGLMREAGETIAAAPGQAIAADVVSNASAGLGLDAAREAGGGPLLQGISAIAAGMAPASIASIAAGARPQSTGAQIATQRADASVRDAQAFENLDVRKFGPAFSQGPVAGIAKGLSDTAYIGAPVRNALDESLFDTARASKDIAARFGSAATPEEGGKAAQQALERYKDARPDEIVEREAGRYSPSELNAVIASPARETSFKTKQAALYQRAWDRLPEEMRDGRSVEGETRLMERPAHAAAVLKGIMDRNARMTVQSGDKQVGAQALKPVTGGLLTHIFDAIRNPKWRANLQTLRDMRSHLRRLSSGMPDTEKNTLKLSEIDALESALTRDMVTLLERNALSAQARGEAETAGNIWRSIKDFKTADKFTRLAHGRMEKLEKLFNAPDADTLFQKIIDTTFGPSKTNMELLRSMKKVLRDEDRNQIAAAVIHRLGRPVGSARGASEEFGFSVSSALTKWNNMSRNNPAARNMVFGNEHAAALDDMVRVWRRMANVEAQANTSKSGTTAINVGGVLAAGGLWTAGFDGFASALGVAGTGFGASLLLSRPGYVRWATGYAKLRAALARSSAKGTSSLKVERSRIASHVNTLRLLADNDNALADVYHAVARENDIPSDDNNDQPSQ